MRFSTVHLPWHFARRYFRAPKSTNTINLISYISIGGIAVGTMAIILVLSVFNGFEGLVISLYNQFNPELIIESSASKSFVPDSVMMRYLKNNPSLNTYSFVIEENVLLKFGTSQCIARIKGVEANYNEISPLSDNVFHGEYLISDKQNNPYIFLGAGLEQVLSVNYDDPFGFVSVYVPKKGKRSVLNPEDAFVIRQLKPSGSFAIQQDFDSRFAFIPIETMRELTGYQNQVNSIELSVKNKEDIVSVQRDLQNKLGTSYKIINRFQQNEVLYKVMSSERWAVLAILAFIIAIAAFNIIGSVSMLVVEKQKDISVLHILGMHQDTIRRIFVYQGIFLSLFGFLIGASLATLICTIQLLFGVVPLEGGSFVIDAYPVEMRAGDYLLSFLIVMAIGSIASYLPGKKAKAQDLRMAS
ncbi:MAG: FtsX-like permease family protein [Bacteroidetes bacterium]|nr:FtsX-like permease family protein [Bacteroidota bacterium]